MKRIVILCGVALGLLALTACSQAGAKYGRAIPSEMKVSPAGEILANPVGFEGKDVLVQGKITSECPSGGWVWLKDNSGELYVNMHPTNVFIPQKVGSTVKAMGKVVLEQGRPQIVGYGLEF
jgi:hypothetical protein